MRFEASDGVGLAGLLYESRAPRALIWLHGTGGASIFESRRTNLLARALLARDIAFFPFNNRGAHIVRRAGAFGSAQARRRLGGSAFERIRDCVFDIDGAVRELRRRGYRELFLAGHSTGANKVAVYDHRKPRNHIKRYILLAGGDDTALVYDRRLLAKARSMIQARRGDELMPALSGAEGPALSRAEGPALSGAEGTDRLMSWRAYYDMANPRGDYNVFGPPWRQIRRIRKPSLYIYGDRDEFNPDVATLARHIAPRAEIIVLEDTDHGFTGREGEVGEIMADWLLSS